MSKETLKVNFAWKRLRSQLSENKEKTLSRTAKYIKHVKENDQKKYKAHLQQDAERKKVNYISIKERSEEEQMVQKRKWQAAQRKSRKRKQKTDVQSTSQEISISSKRFKDLSDEERREYYRIKRQKSRQAQSHQKAKANRTKDSKRKRKERSNTPALPTSQRESISKSSVWRTSRTIQAAMPKSPEAYAEVVNSLVGGKQATPRKRLSMRKKGIARRHLAEEFIVKNFKSSVEKYRSKTNTSRQALYTVVKSCMGSKSSVGSSILRRYLGLNYYTLKKISKTEKIVPDIKRKRQIGIITEKVAAQVTEFWLSPDVSRPLPLKKRVKNGVPLHLLECSYTTAYRRFNV